MSNSVHKVADVDEIEDDDLPILVDLDGREVGVFRIEDEYFAVANYCPHANGPLCEGDVTGTIGAASDGTWQLEKEDELISCPWHGWDFDIRTGKNVRTDRFRTPTYEVEVKDGELFVLL